MKTLFKTINLVLLVALLFALPATGQDDKKKTRKPKPDAKAESPKKDTEKESEKPEEPKDRYFVLKGGDVYTVTGPVLRNTTILVKNDVIEKLGREVEVPEGAEVLDVTGFRVYPGLVAVSSSRLVGREPPEHSTDIFGLNMILGLSGGLTTVVTGNTAAKLTFGTLDDMVVKRGIFTTLRYGRRSPKAKQELQNDLEKVRAYLRDVVAWQEAKAAGKKDAKEPDKKWIKGKYATYLNLLKGELTALVSANEMQDIRDVSDLANHFGFRLVIRGGIEAWTVASELGRKGVSMIVTPRLKGGGGMYSDEEYDCDCNTICSGHDAREAEKKHTMEGEDEFEELDEELLRGTWSDPNLNRPGGWTIENAALLYGSGVPFAIIPRSGGISLGGIAGRDNLMLPMEAAFAVRGGLPEQAALEAITINAARILGIDRWVGSIEEGKDADFIVCDGDILHYKTMVQWSVVNGRVVYDKEKEPLFAHIRPRSGEGTRETNEYWPRDFGPMPSFAPEVEPPGPGEETEEPKEGEAPDVPEPEKEEPAPEKPSPDKPEKKYTPYR